MTDTTIDGEEDFDPGEMLTAELCKVAGTIIRNPELLDAQQREDVREQCKELVEKLNVEYQPRGVVPGTDSQAS